MRKQRNVCGGVSTTICLLLSLLFLSENAVAVSRVIDISGGTKFNRGVLGTNAMGQPIADQTILAQQNWEGGWLKILTEFQGTSVRGIAGGAFAETYNWKTLEGLGAVDFPDQTRHSSMVGGQSMLEFQRISRDCNSVFIMTVNSYGIGTVDPCSTHVGDIGNFTYTDKSTSTMVSQASDLVRYANHIVQSYRQGDTITDTTDSRILGEINWSCTDSIFRSDKLLARGEAAVPKVKYWEIGNEVDNGEKFTTAQAYHDRYAAMTAAMIAQDPTIKVGPSVEGPGYADTFLMAILNDPTLRVDFIAYHPYVSTIMGYDSTTSPALVTALLGGLNSFYQSATVWGKSRITSSGRDVNKVELLATEYNAANTSTFWLPTQYSALGFAESAFCFAADGWSAATIWEHMSDWHTGNEWPSYKVQQAMLNNMGDTLVDSYVSDPNCHVYTTKDSSTGKIAIWGLNFKYGNDVTDPCGNNVPTNITISLKNLPYNPSKITLMRLRSVREDLAAYDINPAGIPTTLTTSVGAAGNRKHAGAINVDWTYDDVSDANLSNFTLSCYPAEVTVLVVEMNPYMVKQKFNWPAPNQGLGNPYTDPNGNKWTCYQALEKVDFGTNTNWIYPAQYGLMTWNNGSLEGPNSVSGYPEAGDCTVFSAYLPASLSNTQPSLVMRARFGGNTGTFVYLVPVVTFEPNMAGLYSIYGSINAENFNVPNDQIQNPNIVFGKITSATGRGWPYGWINLYTVTMPYDIAPAGFQNRIVKLELIPQLQHIYLAKGEKLAMVVDDSGYWTSTGLYTNRYYAEPLGIALENSDKLAGLRATGQSLTADLNQDGYVTFKDFATLAAKWLNSN